MRPQWLPLFWQLASWPAPQHWVGRCTAENEPAACTQSQARVLLMVQICTHYCDVSQCQPRITTCCFRWLGPRARFGDLSFLSRIGSSWLERSQRGTATKFHHFSSRVFLEGPFWPNMGTYGPMRAPYGCIPTWPHYFTDLAKIDPNEITT